MDTQRMEDMNVKRCNTASGWLLHDNKVLLIKHKMLGIWLSPGGHIEENELPHQAAEREFLEETGIKVKAISAFPHWDAPDTDTENLPLPFINNLHWINKPGESKKNPHSGKICEQHYVFGFFVKPVGSLEIHDGDLGVDAIQWFGKDEIAGLETRETIKKEIQKVFELYPVQ